MSVVKALLLSGLFDDDDDENEEEFITDVIIAVAVSLITKNSKTTGTQTYTSFAWD